MVREPEKAYILHKEKRMENSILESIETEINKSERESLKSKVKELVKKT